MALEQGADRGGREALAERRHDAAGDEDVLGLASRIVRITASSRVAEASNKCRTRSRSSGVSTPTEPMPGLHHLDADALDKARSCSSDSACSSGAAAARRTGGARPAGKRRADVRPVPRRRSPEAARARNRGPGRRVGDDLDDVAARDVFGGLEAARQSVRHLERRIVHNGATAASMAWLDQRLVALHVDDTSQGSVAATSASRSVPVRWSARVITAAPPNARRRPRCARRRSRRSPVARAERGRAPVHVLDHRPAANIGERLFREIAWSRIGPE